MAKQKGIGQGNGTNVQEARSTSGLKLFHLLCRQRGGCVANRAREISRLVTQVEEVLIGVKRQLQSLEEQERQIFLDAQGKILESNEAWQAYEDLLDEIREFNRRFTQDAHLEAIIERKKAQQCGAKGD